MLLEVLITVFPGASVSILGALCSAKNGSYESNLGALDQWLARVEYASDYTIELILLVKRMLQSNRAKRPTAKSVTLQLASLDESREDFHCERCHQWFVSDPETFTKRYHEPSVSHHELQADMSTDRTCSLHERIAKELAAEQEDA